MADVVIRVKNGKIKSCEEQDHPLSVEEVDW
jgi:putative ABC transport system ATP-binding protein